MNIAEKLELAIKANETGSADGAYSLTHNGKTLQKQTCMTNEEWSRLVFAIKTNKTQPNAYAEYSEGRVGELSEKSGRPPRMASYGSSSRMIYKLSADKAGFHYRKKLPAAIGGGVILDGFFEDDTRRVLVETKCRELYSKKASTASERYRELYEYLNSRMLGNINIEMQPSGAEGYMNVDFFADGERLERFDLKQMISHLLGIATGLLKGSLEPKQTDFIYLLYDPTELGMERNVQEAVDCIYERACYECNLIDFAELFRAVLEFLNEHKFKSKMVEYELDGAVLNFTFTLATQDFYPILLQ